MKPGDSFAQYEIQGPIGAGGMGEVFLAHDTKLRRDVAVKILPPGFAADKERIARFEREARALASLQHTNVASIYGFEEVDDRLFLVMEMIEGEDLSKRIERGSVPVETALDIARQIATGLEAAHEKGIIHRDLKPANVKLTPDGQVKILDFGLARSAEGEDPDDDPGASPTLTAAMTMEGVILGTAAYMSPEQARGKTADRRADIWAFGCLLYEMLTGKRLFAGETVSDTLAAVLRKDPNWDALPAGLDPAVLLLLRRCLERKPADRLQHIGDARILLDEKLASDDSSATTTGRSRIPVLVLAGLLVVSVALNLTNFLKNDGAATTADGPQVQHLAASLAPRAPLARARAHPLGIGRPTLSISPDGASLVYVAEVDGQTQLQKKRFDAALAEKIPGTEGAFHPVFSPNGDWIAFFTADKLRKVLFAGSEPVTLCEVRNPFSLTWESESSLLVAALEGGEIRRVDAGSGSNTKLHEVDSIQNLSQLPGTHNLLVHQSTLGINPDSWSVGSLDLVEGSYQSIIEGGFSPRYVPTGHLVYVRGGNLMGVAFDPVKLETRGRPVPVVAGLRIARRSQPTYDFSDNGTLVYVSGPPATLSHLVWADRLGGITKLPLPPQFYGDFQISPDGRHVAAMVGGDRDDIWIFEMERGTRRKLNTDGDAVHPIWSPDGKYLAFGSRRGESFQTYIRPVDGSEPARPIGVEGVLGSPYAWITENEIVLTGDGDINVVDIVQKTVTPAAVTDAQEWGPHFSPNGRWMAYTSDESGQYEVYVKPYPELSGAWAISINGGEEPIWSRDGKSLYYRNGDTWLEVPISFDPNFSMGTPRVALEGPYINVPGRSYDLSADGSKFLVILDEGTEEFSRHVEVVLNWFDELERLVPTR
jgi:serine/threonine protein kinase/Tol biopolymer transport system component